MMKEKVENHETNKITLIYPVYTQVYQLHPYLRRESFRISIPRENEKRV